MAKQNKKIYVGLSGGVDSSVSAALLKEAGFDVTGVFIKVWQPEGVPCTWREDRQDAMRVCATLDIPFETLDLEEVYKREVVDYMIREYKAGRTPNPDIMCNKHVKFGAFLDWAKGEGVGGIATGHYARILPASSGKMRESTNAPGTKFRNQEIQNWYGAGKIQMPNRLGFYAGVDANKDQSYFLWTLKQEDLPFIHFPVGGYEKDETRRLAKRFGLPTAEKKDSQGLCFIGKLDMKEFLSEYIAEQPGEVVNEEGAVLGEHDGATFYTLGERHGFRITQQAERGPYYVISKDMEANRLIVSHTPVPHDETSNRTASLEQVNWIGRTPEKDTPYLARIRHRGELHEITIDADTAQNSATVRFKKEAQLVSPGQSLVVYAEDSHGLRCVGGGIITKESKIQETETKQNTINKEWKAGL